MAAKPWQPEVQPVALSATAVARQFRELLHSGWQLLPAGTARHQPQELLHGYTPKHVLEFFGHRYFLTNVRHDNQFRFFVGYVQTAKIHPFQRERTLYPRIFYKDSSLIWRVATHYIKSENEHWIGKGDIKPVVENGEQAWYSAEETTNLPYEIQNALDAVSRRVSTARPDRRALAMILRNAPDKRVIPYADFSTPRQVAMADPALRINNNQPVAWFTRANDPRSLRFAPGFAPDFDDGLIAASTSRSRLYGGQIRRFRLASINRQIQYLVMKAPRQTWIIPPQAMTDEIFSYGVRAVDAEVDDNLCIPGYEYHYLDQHDDPPSLFSQIPAGFAGPASKVDPLRADASPWNHQMPIVTAFHAALPRLRRLAAVKKKPPTEAA